MMSTNKRALLRRLALMLALAPVAATAFSGVARADWRDHERFEHRERYHHDPHYYAAPPPPPVYYAPPAPPPGITLTFPIR
jgi:hypothetical protein